VSEAQFVIIVLAPQREKGTKNAIETGRTFATLFADVNLRNELLKASTVEEFKKLLLNHTQQLMSKHSTLQLRRHSVIHDVADLVATQWRFAAGIVDDVKRRWPHYLSDYIDGELAFDILHVTVT
jgi:sodium borate transporter 11